MILDFSSLIERLSELYSDKLLDRLADTLSDFTLLDDSDKLFAVLADSLKLLLREAADSETLVLNDSEVLLDAEVLSLADFETDSLVDFEVAIDSLKLLLFNSDKLVLVDFEISSD